MNKMKLLCGVLFLIGVITSNNASKSVTMKRIATDQLLMKQLLDARAASNPGNAMECFGIYVPIFNEIVDEFSKSYEACETEADDQKSELNAAAAANRTQIISEAEDVCSIMTECSNLEDSLPFFDCYSRVGDANIKSVFTLTNEASDDAATLREQMILVDNEMYKCENASERAFVEDTAKTQEALDNCFANGPPQVVTTTTEAPETTETATPEVETTTLAEDALDEELYKGNIKGNKYQRKNRRLGN